MENRSFPWGKVLSKCLKCSTLQYLVIDIDGVVGVCTNMQCRQQERL